MVALNPSRRSSVNVTDNAEPAQQVRSGSLLYYHRNQQYSITALTDATGTISERYAYDAYGKPTVLDGGGTVLGGSAYGNRYTYTGREWDGELGLYHYRARMYSPESGRFVSRDPIGFIGGINLFEYVGSRPLATTDPNGKMSRPTIHPIYSACAYVYMCWQARRNIFANNGAESLTSPQQDCLKKLRRAIGGGYSTGRCFKPDNLVIGTKITTPGLTSCHQACQANWSFIQPQQASCLDCAGAIEGLLTILHECVHRNEQWCQASAENCNEVEAYHNSQHQIMADRPGLCRRMVQEGLCADVETCQRTITQVITDDAQNLQEYAAKCRRDRRLLDSGNN